MTTVTNWFKTIQCAELSVEEPESEEKLRDILCDPTHFPSPVRPVGSLHSMTECIAARAPGQPRWGTVVSLRKLAEQPLRLDLQRDAQGDSLGTVTVPAGRTFISVARELREKDLQLRVNTELGPLTMGAAACGATKDSSFPDEPGQVCHDVVGMRLMKPDGKIEEFKEGDADLDALRCSYGLFGVVTHVTFRVYRHQYISIRHEKLEVGEFEECRQRWVHERNAVFLYMFPFAKDQRIIAELRSKVGASEGREVSVRLQARNYFWGEGLHRIGGAIRELPKVIGRPVGEVQQKSVAEFLRQIDLDAVSPVAQIVDFEKLAEERKGETPKFTFSMWAFPTRPGRGKPFAEILAEYFRFCGDQRGFSPLLPQVSYHIEKDTSSLLSYSHQSDVWTLDPIAAEGEPGWEEFAKAFNDRCSQWGGTPLFNQTPFLERRHVVKAFGDRLATFEATRRRFDPGGRMLNEYFARLLTG
jgi:hypothetical protein